MSDRPAQREGNGRERQVSPPGSIVLPVVPKQTGYYSIRLIEPRFFKGEEDEEIFLMLSFVLLSLDDASLGTDLHSVYTRDSY